MFGLENKVAVVIGGTSGIGAESARWLHRAGAATVGAGRRDKQGQDVARELGTDGLYVRTDVTREDEVIGLMRTVVDRFGRIDILVNSAGVINRVPLPELSREHWDRMVEVNLTGVFLACRHAVPVMQRHHAGSIITIASYLAFRGGAGNTPVYNAAKAGIVGLTCSLAVRHGRDGIRVNSVCPAFVPTDLNRDRWEGLPPEQLRRMAERYPLGRLGTPADVAAAVVFLASD
ncbi:MAG: SDR family NAD(P)-dependent oxidoreductase, partial [Gemmatimonadales bacterium]